MLQILQNGEWSRHTYHLEPTLPDRKKPSFTQFEAITKQIIDSEKIEEINLDARCAGRFNF